jgi:hypothetical protein
MQRSLAFALLSSAVYAQQDVWGQCEIYPVQKQMELANTFLQAVDRTGRAQRIASLGQHAAP